MEELQNKIDYKFNNKKILQRALTHPSHNSGNGGYSYETYEFLGDAVLALLISDYLINKYPNETEGDLARRRSALVNGETLAKIAISLDLGKHIILARSEESIGGRENPHNLENSLEAIIGAMYLDGGLEKVKNIINKFWVPIAEGMTEVPSNPKTRLQEWSQSQGKEAPYYNLLSTVGPPHSPKFEIELAIGDMEPIRAFGTSKKVAETNAAKLFIEKYIK